MRDIPAFTTQNGAASLILQEIPNNAKAYICICDSHNPDVFLQECCDFCIAAGAETIYADGVPAEGKYVHYTDVFQMRRTSCDVPATDAKLTPVTEETLAQWRQLYNDNMKDIPAAFFMSLGRAKDILKKGSGYFIYRHDNLLGIGVASGNTVDCIISFVPGAGRDVFSALCKVLTGDEILLEVASENKRAISFYKKMGFVTTQLKYRWYRIYPAI